MERVRLGDCWIDGCMRDAFQKVTLLDTRTGERSTGVVCDEHAREALGSLKPREDI